MLSWIFSSEEYTNLYHELFSEFISKYFDGGYLEQLISDTKELLSLPMWKRTPQNSAPMSSLKRGVLTLSEFCSLRAKSIKGQLGGTFLDVRRTDRRPVKSCVGRRRKCLRHGQHGRRNGREFPKRRRANADFANGGPQSADASDSASQSDLNTGTASAAPDSPPSASTATESFFAAELVKPRKPSVFSRAAVGGFPTRFWRWRFCRRKDCFSVGLPPPFRPQKPFVIMFERVTAVSFRHYPTSLGSLFDTRFFRPCL